MQALSDCRAELAKQTATIAATEKQIEDVCAQLEGCKAVCGATKCQCSAEAKERHSLLQCAYDVCVTLPDISL